MTRLSRNYVHIHSDILSKWIVKTPPATGESFCHKQYNESMTQTKTSSLLILIGLNLFVTLFVFFMYTFLHESGHAFTGTLFGQSLTEFDVNFWNLNAHVSMVGGSLTESQLAVQAVAGAGLPLIFWAVFISLVPRKASFTLEALKFISSMAVVNTLLVWIVLPILYMLQSAPPDDVTNFLRHSQMLPLLLTFIASILYAGGWVLFLSKINGLRNELLLFSITDREQLTAETKKMILRWQVSWHFVSLQRLR